MHSLVNHRMFTIPSRIHMNVMLHKRKQPETTWVKEKPNHPHILEEDRKQKKRALPKGFFLYKLILDLWTSSGDEISKNLQKYWPNLSIYMHSKTVQIEHLKLVFILSMTNSRHRHEEALFCSRHSTVFTLLMYLFQLSAVVELALEKIIFCLSENEWSPCYPSWTT